MRCADIEIRYTQPGKKPASKRPSSRRMAIKPAWFRTRPWPMVAIPQRSMMAASQVDGATLLRMMLLGTYSHAELSVVIQWEGGCWSDHLEQNVRDEEGEESHVVIVPGHVQVVGHALYLCVPNIGAVEERKPDESQISIHGGSD
jgi:hypothetical protein